MSSFSKFFSEDALRKIEESNTNFISRLDEGFELLEIVYDKEGKIEDFVFLEVNSAYEKLTGLKAANIIGKRKKEVAPAVEQRWYDYVIQAVEKGKTLSYQYYNPKVNAYFEAQFIPISSNKVAVLFKDITERKKVEEALIESEIKFRTVADFTYDWEHWISPEGVFIYVSPSSERITGFKPEEFIEDPELIIKMVHPDDQSLIESHYKSINSKELPDFDYRIITKNGKVRWIAHACQPVFDSNGTWLGRRGNNRDITERKKAEEALLESEEKYKQLVDRLPEMIFEIDSRGNVVFANSKALEVLGYSAGEFRNPFDANRFVAAEDIERSKYCMKEMFSEGLRQSNEYLFVRKDGSRFPVLLISVPVVKDHIIVGARGIAVDLTELRHAQHELKESENRYHNLFSSMSEMLFLADLIRENKKVVDFIFHDVNPAFLKSIGKSRKQVVGKRASDLLGELSGLWLKELNKVVEARTAIHAEVKSELTGHYYDVVAWKSNGNQVAVILQDITQRKDLERQLQEKERLATIGQTAGMVGHDIRNPLQAILSDIYLLKDELTLSEYKNREGVTESIASIEENINYINKIVSDLQDYARPISPEYATVNLSNVIVRVFETVRLPDSIELLIKVKDLEKLRTDAMLLQRVITNLVNNAVQAMPDGGKLEIAGYPADKAVVIVVSDTGMGIPEEIKPKLFTPMMTTKSKGQGFGLAVSKRLIEAMKGTISFDSEKGKGTKFMIELPTF